MDLLEKVLGVCVHDDLIADDAFTSRTFSLSNIETMNDLTVRVWAPLALFKVWYY